MRQKCLCQNLWLSENGHSLCHFYLRKDLETEILTLLSFLYPTRDRTEDNTWMGRGGYSFPHRLSDITLTKPLLPHPTQRDKENPPPPTLSFPMGHPLCN
jgi:hypothetical protein